MWCCASDLTRARARRYTTGHVASVARFSFAPVLRESPVPSARRRAPTPTPARTSTPSSLVGQIVEEPIESLVPWPGNPRRGDIDAVAASIRENGFFTALVCQRSTRRVLAGNHRLAAARQVGMQKVPVIWVDVDDRRAKRILLADNRTNDLARYDDESLYALLNSLTEEGGLEGTGYGPVDLQDLLGRLHAPSLESLASGAGVRPGSELVTVTLRLLPNEAAAWEGVWSTCAGQTDGERVLALLARVE